MQNRKRKLFCEISPLCYEISVAKCCLLRRLRDLFDSERFCRLRSNEPLPVVVCRHKSLIRRQLGDVDMALQENKAVNLALAAPKNSGVLIRPGEVFSLWRPGGEDVRPERLPRGPDDPAREAGPEHRSGENADSSPF